MYYNFIFFYFFFYKLVPHSNIMIKIKTNKLKKILLANQPPSKMTHP